MEYEQAMRRQLALMDKGLDLGIHGCPAASRDELHLPGMKHRNDGRPLASLCGLI